MSNHSPLIELANSEMWYEFHKETNEMVLNKAGRKMFPQIKLNVKNLYPKGSYFLTLMMRPVDTFKYKFQSGAWSPSIPDPGQIENSNMLIHPDTSPLATGEYIMRNALTFNNVKLTNIPKPEGQQISLTSMRKYQPIISLYYYNHGNAELVRTFEPKILEFVAVTAYQNQNVINLKIRYNPFAKGFREGSARKRSSITPETPNSSPESSESLSKRSFGLTNVPLSNFSGLAQNYNPFLNCFSQTPPNFFPISQNTPYFNNLFSNSWIPSQPINYSLMSAAAFTNPTTAAALAMFSNNKNQPNITNSSAFAQIMSLPNEIFPSLTVPFFNQEKQNLQKMSEIHNENEIQEKQDETNHFVKNLQNKDANQCTNFLDVLNVPETWKTSEYVAFYNRLYTNNIKKM